MIPTAGPQHDLDVIVLGRAGMDLYPQPDGTPTHLAASFKTDLGGSSGNIAVALARHGLRVGLAAPVSDDPVGQFVSEALRNYGVEHLTPTPISGQERTSLALAEIRTDARTVIYRNNAADFAMDADAVRPHLGRAPVVIVTGTALAQEPSRSTCLEALASADCAILDLDYRPYSWRDDADTQATYANAVAKTDILIGNDEEFAYLAPEGPREHARALANDKTLVVFKEGPEGSTALTCDAEHIIPAYPVTALKPFGAGDSFMGGLVARLIAGDPLPDAIRAGSAAAAMVVARAGCASAMPTWPEIQAFLKEHD